MKKVVGIISGGGASPNHRLGGSFVLFEDSTFVPITTGTGYSECKFKAFWESLTLGL